MQQDNQLQQVIDLIEKTGDKAIVLEKDRPAYVMMGLKEYERLILGKSEVRGLTEDELLDKINREIAVWKSGQEKIKEIEDEYTDLEDKWEPDLGFDWRDEERQWMRDEYDREMEREIEKEIERDMERDRHEDVFGDRAEIDDIELPPFDFEDKESDFEIPGLEDKPKFEEDKFYVEPME